MPSVFCLFQTVTVAEGNIAEEQVDLLVRIFADETIARKTADKLNAEHKAFYHVEIWNVQ